MGRKFCDLVDEREPRILAFNTYADEQGELSAVVQVHPDAESMEFHFRAMADQLEVMHEYLERVESVELFGTPSERVLRGVSVYQDVLKVMPVHSTVTATTPAASRQRNPTRARRPDRRLTSQLVSPSR